LIASSSSGQASTTAAELRSVEQSGGNTVGYSG
jgi:hypothetical protein